MSKIIIYTDGSCIWNPWPGGWAYLLMFADKQKLGAGQWKNTTNNQMELTAVIKALQALNTDKYTIEIFTDSKYVMDGATKWIVNWKKKWWKTANKQDVKNKELWQKLDELTSKFNIKRHWVKWHDTNEFNNLVDEKAQEQARLV